MNKKIALYDTTLRDGSQTEGISLSVMDKLRIAQRLDKLGIQYIEGGWPGSNPKDMEFFKKIKRKSLKNSAITAFGSTRRPGKSTGKDKNVRTLLESGCKVITIFGKSSVLHVRDILRTSNEENLKMIYDTVKYLKSKGKTVFFDAEHFFDGYFGNPSYALKTLIAAQDAGSDTIILCDTNGGTLTHDLSRVISEIKPNISVPLGIHAHNDNALAVANSLAAVSLGCQHVQGTINGYGERCGNADLCAIIANLKIKMGIDCVSDSKLKELTEVSRFVAEACNMKHQDNQPFVGQSAFAHKGGVHINAVMKNPHSYEHIRPDLVGNKRRVLVSELSGKSTILFKAKEMELDLKGKDRKTKKILNLLQDLEHKGYHFEAAQGSFELLVKRALKKYKDFFKLEGYKVIIEKTEEGKVRSEATIKLRVKDKVEYTASKGDGPVNALDRALRKALLDFYPALAKMHLSDFRVRVLDEKAGTAAKVRVLIQSQDAKKSWWTIGVSENIIEASWDALVDSVEYKLLKG
ncbi:MAG: citramalate synthase [Candidatus Omnitrophota bacterium]|nr:MAG: citramalate synthase [Candidatus Omnitrophota bacterium]